MGVKLMTLVIRSWSNDQGLAIAGASWVLNNLLDATTDSVISQALQKGLDAYN